MMPLDLASLGAAYRARRLTVRDTVEHVLGRIAAHAGNPVWIARFPDETLRERAAALDLRDPATLPLYGVPVAVKDNIDVAGLPTTAACPAFAYSPVESATVVQRLEAAGALVIGKTNLDQFATGLVGTRSPYGIVQNSFDAAYVSGGSSSGSAVALALGQVSLALGTDTAGSGRIPAAFNNLVGYKPTLGALSTHGMVPACRTLDAISVFALTAADAAAAAAVMRGHDAADPWSRQPVLPAGRGWSHQPGLRVAVPRIDQLEFFGNTEYARLFAAAIERCAELGATIVETDIAPLLAAARLLYEGPWVAERYLAAQALLERDPQALHPVTRRILVGGATATARDAFAARYRLQQLTAAAQSIWDAAPVLLLPTAGTHWTIAEEQRDPIARNSDLGHYTNFVNLLDLAAVALPSGFTARGLPFGVTLVAPAWHDAELLQYAHRLHQAADLPLGALRAPWPASGGPPPDPAATIDIAVCGAHLAGLPLNHQLTSRGAWRVASTHTTAEYRLYALPGGPPARPGLVRVAHDGGAIGIEIWRLPAEHFASFVAGIPAPLGIGRVRTAAHGEVWGFLCEAVAAQGARDVTAYGDWRAWLAAAG